MPLLGPEDVEESDFQGMSERLVLEAIESRGNLEVGMEESESDDRAIDLEGHNRANGESTISSYFGRLNIDGQHSRAIPGLAHSKYGHWFFEHRAA